MKQAAIIFTRSDRPKKRRPATSHAGIRLTLRDLELLEALHSTRYLTTPQIQALFWTATSGGCWGNLKACQRRMRQLTRHGLVRRIEQPVKRGEGSKPYIYALGKLGTKALAEELGSEAGGSDLRKSSNDHSYLFLEHLLATNDFRIALTLACRRNNEVTLETWVDERELKTEAKDMVAVSGPGGQERHVAIVPDAYFILRSGERKLHFFVEIDRRTVTVKPSRWERRGWTRKVRAYDAYYRSGAYQQRYRTHSLRILTVTTGQRRLENLREATQEAGGGSRFWFTTFERISQQTILDGSIWQVAGRDGLQTLLH